MAARNATMTLPNPLTPMAFLKPALATKITNQNYAAVGSLAVGLNFYQDIRMCVDSVSYATAGSIVGYFAAYPPRL